MVQFLNSCLILGIPDISEGEKMDKFIQGLKYEVRLEVMKSYTDKFEEADQIALCAYSAIWRAPDSARNDSTFITTNNSSDRTEIGND